MPEGGVRPGYHLAMHVGLPLLLNTPLSALLQYQDATRACNLQVVSLFIH